MVSVGVPPEGTWRTYLGVDVFEGVYSYGGLQVVPGWGGSMFEELMPNVFVPEESWAPGPGAATTGATLGVWCSRPANVSSDCAIRAEASRLEMMPSSSATSALHR